LAGRSAVSAITALVGLLESAGNPAICRAINSPESRGADTCISSMGLSCEEDRGSANESSGWPVGQSVFSSRNRFAMTILLEVVLSRGKSSGVRGSTSCTKRRFRPICEDDAVVVRTTLYGFRFSKGLLIEATPPANPPCPTAPAGPPCASDRACQQSVAARCSCGWRASNLPGPRDDCSARWHAR
jgi:hypothetical protein